VKKAEEGSVLSRWGVWRRVTSGARAESAERERVWQRLLDANRSGFLLCAATGRQLSDELNSEFAKVHLPPHHTFSLHKVLLFKTRKFSTVRYVLSILVLIISVI